MIKNFQYRIYPTKKQLTALETTLEECRWLSNHLLENRKRAYEQEGKSLSCYGQQATYPILKEQHPSLKSVHSQVLQNVAVRIDLAIQAFFRRVKSGETPGYPRFKGYGRYDSFCYPQSGFSITHDSRVSLSKIGAVQMVYHRPVRGSIKTATIHKSSTGKWSITFSCETEPERLEPTSTQVGIDVGLKTFATLSTSEEIENPRFFRLEEKALARVQRKHSQREKGSPERTKHRKVVARVHERTKFKRQDFTHQHSRQIVDRFGVICVEDLHVNRMVPNHCLAKSISDAAWSAFFSHLNAKAEEAGRQFLKVNPAYTSQTCSVCGHRQKMPLSERVYQCPCCLLSIDRDLNASQNILRLGLESLGIQPREAPAISAWGVITKTSDGNTVSISQNIQKQISSLESKLGNDAKITVVSDQAPSITTAITSLVDEALIGAAFAILVILVFLFSIRSTLVTAISIPLSIVIALIGLWVGNYTLNLFTLGGLTIAIGRVVDDSIVVLENIYRHMSNGEEKSVAIPAAVKEVAGAVTSSTLTTVAVFLPLAFVGGIVGQLFNPFAVTVTIALLASLFVALAIIPVLAAWFLKAPKNAAVKVAQQNGHERMFPCYVG